MSDAQLLALHTGDYSKLSDDELKGLHNPTPEPVKEAPGIMEALMRGAGQGATLGFRDEAQGLKADPHMGDAYRQARDSERASNDAAHQAHPWAYNIGQFGGGVVPATVAAPLAGASAVATGIGALAGLGNSQADVTQGAVAGAAKDTAIGGATGWGLNKVGSYIASKLGGAAPQEPVGAPAKDWNFPVAKSPAPPFDPANPPAAWQPKNPDAPFLQRNVKDIFSGGGSSAPAQPAPAPVEAPAAPAPTESRVGKTIGGVIGESLGKMVPIPGAGYAGSKLGEAAGTKIESAIKDGGLDKISEMLKSTPQAFGRWAPSLIQAAQRGGNALAVQHFLLMQNDPAYRKQVQQ